MHTQLHMILVSLPLRRAGAGELAERLGVLVTLSEDWSLVPSTHVGKLTNYPNSTF